MDIKNFYTENGSGFPLILLHGNGEDSSYFEHQIDVFAKYYKVYAIDTRGHGKTLRGNKPFTLEQFAQDLFNFMNDKNIHKAHILGFSDGGNIALIFSILYPERVEKLILNGANLFPKGLTCLTQMIVNIEYKLVLLFQKKNKLKKEMLELMVKEPNIFADDLSKIKSKTLVIAGTNDMIKNKHTLLIANSIPNSRLVFIKGDHFIANKKPNKFNEKVLEFLKDEQE